MQLVVARVGRAHGIKGEVTVEVRTDEPELRLGPGAVLATDPADRGPLTIESGRVHSGRLLLRFAGVRDRNGAEALRNTLLIAEVDPAVVPEDPDEYYDHQLIDLDVVTEDGTEVGRITEISHLPSQDLFIVERPDGSEVMIPFVTEIVTSLDLDEQRAVINPPPGLIDDRAEIASAREAEREASEAADTTPGSESEDATGAERAPQGDASGAAPGDADGTSPGDASGEPRAPKGGV
ncbi:ribosome maturation factor RimM [Streptomyces sp. NPDC057638]|uniref:ribosome maturation factor RimM n=1 Tax=Streptomyces sp. NPDC057638 TaxID=3346190 RepID=UPI0036B51431